MKNFLSLLALLIISAGLSAQTEKQELTFDDILKWNRITETHLSNNGKYIAWKEEPWKGDATLKISTPEAKEIASFNYGTKAQFSNDSRYLIFTEVPPADTIRALKLKKTKKEDLPQNKLVVFDIEENKSETIENLKSVKVPEEWSGWIAYQAKDPNDSTKSKKDKKHPLYIKDLATGSTKQYPAVSSYELAKDQPFISFISEGDSTFTAGVYLFDLKAEKLSPILEAEGKFEQLCIADNGEQLAFLADSTDAEKPSYSLYHWGGETESIIADNTNAAIPENWEISENGKLSFSDNGERLFFGTAPIVPEKDTTILEEEIPALDVWTWNEEQLQTVQLNNQKKDLKKSYLAVVHLNQQKTVQLETEQFSRIGKIQNGDADKLLAFSNRPYAVQAMWEGGPYHNDFYLVDINSGEAEKFKTDCRANPSVSPDGKFVYWYNAIDTTWNTYEIATGKEYQITDPATIQAANELNDVPNLPGSYRNAGWLEDDAAILIYDRYDIWKVDPTNSTAPVNLTKNGRSEKINYRLVRFNPEPNTGINSSETVILTGHNEISRADAYYAFNLSKTKTPEAIFSQNYKLGRPVKAEDDNLIVFTKEDFETYPNLIATDLRFKKETQLSDAAPQQKDFKWGTAELVTWRSLDGLVLEGTLHKPEDFDPNKKYPMIVNFYEKSSQNLLGYRMPENHRSTIDYHYYTSNGYIIFNPDVYYKEGYPGESAFNCVMPGVTALIAKGFVDEDHIGAQGHSWGGYQVAYLATRTNMFAAIESGAPVVNMFSAYGGIRWGSGLNRSFQYEHTQSRIGKSIWESPLRYLENSPLFTLDKINTPILIMHNDDDGAVPWYQGIEFFIGLRRMQKPSWLLNYNEADHWPTKLRDMHDFQIRMAQFFDHYLKDAPMPKWMDEGIPAVNKGIDMGYELVE
ncbi:prolyl oligopeptidase family serine peptidase [Draconibacterium sp. IB214405]|uniref:S9 family peptidase n=1 Tax=Draconibacterium sp. IB214405 TaxID=3097352 RepID=UPI002A1838FA|nr:prolyl oligopeptidase family serine peptidase [Draconibacterium sp. IB214405]MDX8340720.1 prolyl oligopeptidase family serine peptidase [Draconibacterium sp. IB214405]